jgi:hypothetical protein
MMPHEVDFNYFGGMTRNEMESDAPRQFMYRSYCDAWTRGDLIEVDRLLPKLGLRRTGSNVERVKP